LVKTILDGLSAAPRINRKELAEKLLVDLAGQDEERAKLALASDLRWLISEGYVIEFNDGSLDLPRVKAKPPESPHSERKVENVPEVVAAVAAASGSTVSTDEAEIGGS